MEQIKKALEEELYKTFNPFNSYNGYHYQALENEIKKLKQS